MFSLWTGSEPCLHRLRITLRSGGFVFDTVDMDFRSIALLSKVDLSSTWFTEGEEIANWIASEGVDAEEESEGTNWFFSVIRRKASTS